MIDEVALETDALEPVAVPGSKDGERGNCRSLASRRIKKSRPVSRKTQAVLLSSGDCYHD